MTNTFSDLILKCHHIIVVKWYYYFPTIFRSVISWNIWKWLCKLIYNGSWQKCQSLCRVILLASPTQEKRHWDPPRQEAPEKVDIEPSPQLFCTCPTPRGTTHRVFVSTRDTPAVSPHLGESSYHQGEDRLFQATVLESPAFLHSVTQSYITWEYIRSVCFNSRHASSSSKSRRFLLIT